ncbi:MAG: hypothetical protein CFE37_00515 [Alphaproteobacteria bacterium PA4]|nr:MAG: hypothetical protein CFE37_00515 [Alphaproteobacteria bacterium PA4]
MLRRASLVILLLLAGCSTVATVVTAPIKLVGAGIDVAVDSVTTTQEEADRNRGRALREKEEADAKAAKKAEKAKRKAEREARDD